MSLTMAGATALAAGANMVSSAGQYFANKALQEDAQSFNAQEAQLARDFAAQEAANARAFNAEQAQLARDFESTKYQRTIADMKAAGINPAAIGMVNASGGSPMASTASGVSSPAASSGASSVSNSMLGNVLTSAFNSAMLQSMQDEHFTKSLIERTAYNAAKIDNERQRIESMKNRVHLSGSLSLKNGSEPSWFSSYKKDFHKSIQDL